MLNEGQQTFKVKQLDYVGTIVFNALNQRPLYLGVEVADWVTIIYLVGLLVHLCYVVFKIFLGLGLEDVLGVVLHAFVLLLH